MVKKQTEDVIKEAVEWVRDDAKIAENRRLRSERFNARRIVEARRRARDRTLRPQVGIAAYYAAPPSADPARASRLVDLLIDRRWPWVPCWASYSAWDKRQDGKSVRVSGVEPLRAILARRDLTRLHMRRAVDGESVATLALELDTKATSGILSSLAITCRQIDLPPGASFAAFLSLVHELIAALGAEHATLALWPTHTEAADDAWLMRTILDTARGSFHLGVPADFRAQIDRMQTRRRTLGRTVARYPRWGTYLHAEHVAAIGGVEQIRATVAPARIEAIGALTYVQLTETIDGALTAESEEKRRTLQSLMAPILPT